MTTIFSFVAAVTLGVAWWGLCRGKRRLRHTTLVAAWRWSIAAAAAWTAVWVISTFGVLDESARDVCWYVVALLMLCPGIAVLGARRPGVGVWTVFVILPLLAVLGWPLLTIWGQGWVPRTLRLETPVLLGFVLVLMMGAGNYIGTRFRLPAALFVVAICLLAGSVSEVAPPVVSGSHIGRDLATACLGLAVLVAGRAAATRPCGADGIDRLWSDYGNAFGIVWAKRFQDRLNGIAAQQQWPARLEHDGICWNDGTTEEQRDETAAQIEQTFRWLLRRFVDPPWIDERLSGKSDPPASGERASESS